MTEVAEWDQAQPQRQAHIQGRSEDDRPKSEALESPKYRFVRVALNGLRNYYSDGSRADLDEIIKLQSNLVHALAELSSWSDRDIQNIEELKRNYFGKEEFKRNYARIEKSAIFDKSWCGLVGEAVFLRAWQKGVSRQIIDRGELFQVADHGNEQDKAGIDFVANLDYRNNANMEDEAYKTYMSLKTSHSLRTGEVVVTEVDQDRMTHITDRYFSKGKRSRADLVDLVIEDFNKTDEAEYGYKPRVLMIVVGVGDKGDWKQLMRMANEEEFHGRLADKIDDVLTGAYDEDADRENYGSANWMDEVVGQESDSVQVVDREKRYQQLVKRYNANEVDPKHEQERPKKREGF